MAQPSSPSSSARYSTEWKTAGALELTYREPQWKQSALSSLFTVAWFAYVVGADGSSILGYLPLALITAWSVHGIASALWNRVRIDADHNGLVVDVGPVPQRGSGTYPREEIEAITVLPAAVGSKSFFHVWVARGDLPDKIALRSIHGREHAESIATALRKALGLPGDETEDLEPVPVAVAQAEELKVPEAAETQTG